ncbi:unnamed protein product, partial [Amoebophrya sp. A120]
RSDEVEVDPSLSYLQAWKDRCLKEREGKTEYMCKYELRRHRQLKQQVEDGDALSSTKKNKQRAILGVGGASSSAMMKKSSSSTSSNGVTSKTAGGNKVSAGASAQLLKGKARGTAPAGKKSG